MKDQLIKQDYFFTPIYFYNLIDWVDDLNNKCNKYIDIVKKNNENFLINNKDLGFTYHSQPDDLLKDYEFDNFKKFIYEKSSYILNEQGYNISLYDLKIKELWVQEFAKDGGGHHNSHIHSNSHISGFYFLKCSDKTSYPIFHDPRLHKKMNQLQEKDVTNFTNSSELISLKPTPGLFVFFNSFLEHQFSLDLGLEPFRFIHFNIQAVLK